MPERGTLFARTLGSRSLLPKEARPLKPEVGMRYIFIPSIFDGAEQVFFAGKAYDTKIDGVIIAVNKAHRHFTVRGKHPQSGAIFTETFKF